MPLPALDLDSCDVMYLDFMTVYREVVDAATSNPLGYKLVTMSALDLTPLQNVPCNFHRTPNFDQVTTPAGVSKRVNILTSNKITFQYGIPVVSLDVVLITTRYGDTEWQAVQGFPKRPVLIPHSYFYGVPTQPPVILPGLWTDQFTA